MLLRQPCSDVRVMTVGINIENQRLHHALSLCLSHRDSNYHQAMLPDPCMAKLIDGKNLQLAALTFRNGNQINTGRILSPVDLIDYPVFSRPDQATDIEILIPNHLTSLICPQYMTAVLTFCFCPADTKDLYRINLQLPRPQESHPHLFCRFRSR